MCWPTALVNTAVNRNPHSELLALAALRRVRDNLEECYPTLQSGSTQRNVPCLPTGRLAFVDTEHSPWPLHLRHPYRYLPYTARHRVQAGLHRSC
jgi:hypothetical protein